MIFWKGKFEGLVRWRLFQDFRMFRKRSQVPLQVQFHQGWFIKWNLNEVLAAA